MVNKEVYSKTMRVNRNIEWPIKYTKEVEDSEYKEEIYAPPHNRLEEETYLVENMGTKTSKEHAEYVYKEIVCSITQVDSELKNT